jgi:dihydroorotase
MQITLNSPLDMHLHLRDGQMLKTVVPLSAHSFAAAIVMPNLVPPVTTIEAVNAYKTRILEAIGEERFEPLMTLFFQNDYDFAFLESAKPFISAIKLYPAGITTNSESGVSTINADALSMTLTAMSDLGIPLLIHGETEGFVMDREKEFVPIYEELATRFPELTIVMEHITTKESVAALERHDNLYATITLHHLFITLDEVAGGMLQPHLFCKPIAKRPEDRDALLKVALEAHPKVMFGSDSAPNPQNKKEASHCAAGVFTAPIALQLLCEIFDQFGKLDNLQTFVSDNAQSIYGICPEFKEVTLSEKEFIVPEKYGNVVPMYAGKPIFGSDAIQGAG